MVALTEQRDVGEVLERLAAALDRLETGPMSADLAGERDRLIRTIRSYLIPRLIGPLGPLTVVFAGPTGSGKSTLVNSLARLDASRTGALRPTTRTPVVVAPADHVDGYTTVGGVACEVVPAHPQTVDDLVLVDTPDLDSTSTEHRAIAEELIDNADAVVFVTSALRYADEVPWQALRRAAARGTPVIHVLNRVETASAGSIVDFKSRLAEAGFDDELVTVSEHHLAGAGRLPALAVRSLEKRLRRVISEREGSRAEMLGRVIEATLTHIEDLTWRVTEIQNEIDGVEERAGADLVARVAGLDLGSIAAGLYQEPPHGQGALARRLWMRRERQDRESAAGLEQTVIDALVDIVDADVRTWLVGDRPALQARGVDSPHVLQGVQAATRSAAEGWIDFVARIAADFDETNLWLCEAVLLEAAAGKDPASPTVALLFGDPGAALVDRARRELIGRVEVVYEHTGSLVADGLRRRFGDIDDSELRAALEAAADVLAPVHA